MHACDVGQVSHAVRTVVFLIGIFTIFRRSGVSMARDLRGVVLFAAVSRCVAMVYHVTGVRILCRRFGCHSGAQRPKSRRVPRSISRCTLHAYSILLQRDQRGQFLSSLNHRLSRT